MGRTTESDFEVALGRVRRAADEAERVQEEADAAHEELLNVCDRQIRDGVPILYVARAAGINRTRLYRLLGRIPTPTRKAS